MRTPYTTRTGVQIGIRYEPPKPMMTRDEELIQSALLGDRPFNPIESLFTGVMRLWVLAVFLILAYAMASCVIRI